jgi:hypothetical protein
MMTTQDEVSIRLSCRAQRGFLDRLLYAAGFSTAAPFPRNEGAARGGKSHRTGHLLMTKDDHNNRPVPEPRTPFQEGEAQ